MNHFTTSCIAFLLFVSLFAIGISTAAAADDLLEPGVPGALGIQLKSDNFTPEIIERVHRMGFRTVRRGFYWSSIEAVKGQYDFSGWDPGMDKAKELGVTVVGVFFSGNKAYEDNGRGGIQTPERPVYTAATVIFDQLGGYTFDRRLETNNPLDYLVVWKNEKGDRNIVARTAPQSGGPNAGQIGIREWFAADGTMIYN